MSTTPQVHKGRIWRVGLALLLSWAMICGCGRKSEQGSKIVPQEDVAVGTNYQGLWHEVARLQEQIRTEPDNAELRRALVRVAVDTVAHVVWASGKGLVPPGAVSRPVGLQAAQRAALVDAYRWLALVLRWKQDYRTPDFGSVQGTLPGAVTVHCDTSGDQVRVLVQAPLP